MSLVLLALLMSAAPSESGNSSKQFDWRAGQPVVPLPSLFGVADYPADARAQNVQGTTSFRLHISTAGRVNQCDIEQSSGNASLDAATCEIITKRSHFYPAADKSGHNVATTYVGAIKWIL